MYQHKNWQGELIDLPVGKIVCVGSNYALHINEMGGVPAAEPVLFIKPETALCDLNQPIAIPKNHGEVHHEIELAVLIGKTLKNANEDRIISAIAGYGVALDLTLRDLQKECKRTGRPWEKAKGFDGACPISGFIATHEFTTPQEAQLRLTINNQIKQEGNTQEMITPIISLIAYISHFFTLRPGDVVLTGTPAGVGPLVAGDNLMLSLNQYEVSTSVV